MKEALTTRRTLFNGTQAMMVERPSSLAAICGKGTLCRFSRKNVKLEVRHVH